jgi:hypothetical protein
MEAVNVLEFFRLDVKAEELPVLVMVKTKQQEVVFYEELETITQDKLARWVYEHAFSDLSLNSEPQTAT